VGCEVGWLVGVVGGLKEAADVPGASRAEVTGDDASVDAGDNTMSVVVVMKPSPCRLDVVVVVAAVLAALDGALDKEVVVLLESTAD
jgi:hypothetical protein